MNGLLRDIRFALRMLVKRPGYTLVAVLTLALAIGANTAIFSAVNVVLLRPLPYPEPERLVLVYETKPEFEMLPVPYLNYLDYRAGNAAFSGFAALSLHTMSLTGSGEPERLGMQSLSHDFLPLLGVTPMLGRGFLPEEDAPGGAPVVMLTHGLWTRRFAADPAILGRKITLEGSERTVVGVLPPEFRPFFWPFIAAFVPLGARADEPIHRDRAARPEIYLFGRLKPGVTLAQANADLQALGDGLAERFPEAIGPSRPLARPLQEVLVKDSRTMLLLLLAAVGGVLLIAAANVANLTLERAMTRKRELAVRAALGAGRWRLIRQLLVESSLLALAGGALGLLVALWGVDAMNAYRPNALAYTTVGAFEVDTRVLVFTTVVALGTGLLLGLVPALLATRQDLAQALKNADHHVSAGGAHLRARNVLVVVEVALALMLTATATLAARSLAHLYRADPGFASDHVLWSMITLTPDRYPTSLEIVQFFTEVERRIAALPGVLSVTASSGAPGLVGGNETLYPIDAARVPENEINALPYRVDVGFVETLKIPLLAGRTCGPQDGIGTAPVVIVNDALAERLFPGQDPIGRRVQDHLSKQPSVEIVGVVGTIQHDSHDAADPNPYQMQYCYRQLPLASQQEPALGMTMHLILRTAGDPVAVADQLRTTVAGLDPISPLWTVQTLEGVMEDRLAPRLFTARLLGVFAAIALLLAGVGLYAVMANTVAQRTHELGVRMALGAQPRAVVALVMRQGMRLVAVGLVIGLFGALALARVMTTVVTEQIGATDPLTYATTTVMLVTVALLATYIPARRATRIDPMVAMRHE